MLSLLCALSLTLSPQAPAERPDPVPAARNPVPAVRIDGTDLSWDEVADWFLRTFGESDQRSFVRRIAVHREAGLQGCLPTPSEVQAEVDGLIAQRVQGAFQGRREAWLEELSDLGDSEEARRFAMLDAAAMDLELRALVQGGRDSEEASLRALFEDRFGPGGLSLVLDALILRVSYPTRGPSQSREEQRAARAKAENEVRKALLAHRARLESGKIPFEALVAQVSEDADSRARGGRLADFDPRNLRPEATRALYDLAVGGVSDPILYDGRWHLFRVADRVQAEFEAKRPALLQALKEGVVTAPESEDWIAALLARTKITPLTGGTGLEARILQVGGQVLTGRDLGAYMLLHEGGALVQNFVAHTLIEAEARSAGIEISTGAVLARVREDIELQAATETKGDLEVWEAMLQNKTGITRAAYERQAMER
ncbi:MAG: peptidylprolyl isomerase, partial [Planctomycetota bacterium]